jgi:hypothetical protein
MKLTNGQEERKKKITLCPGGDRNFMTMTWQGVINAGAEDGTRAISARFISLNMPLAWTQSDMSSKACVARPLTRAKQN